MIGNYYANNQKDPYVSTTHIPVELTLYGLAHYNYPPFKKGRPRLVLYKIHYSYAINVPLA